MLTGLESEMMPIGKRACFWGGYGGSLIVLDLDRRLALSYVMNRMEGGTTGDLRGASLLFDAYAALAAN